MEESQTKAKNLIMGRADVLLRFLQLISKDSPKELDHYLEDLDTDTELRPLVDQIVDKIISGEEELYKKYEQARREASSRNPYASAEEAARTLGYEEALGHFLSRWINLESTLRRKAEEMGSTDVPRTRVSTLGLLEQLQIPKELREEIYYIRRLRNQAVHGIETPPPEQLETAGRFLEQIVTQLQASSRTPNQQESG